jgi:hypothetical protein
VIAMTQTVRVKMGAAAAGAVLAVATVLGPAAMVVTRLGAGETVGFPTVSAADTITSTAVLAEVAAGFRGR